VAIYADESCLGNGREGENPGGAGVLVEYQKGDGEIVRRDVWISEPATTNNRMALRSVIEGFRAIAHKGGRFRVVFTTDSRYIVDGMTQWVHDWARRGWKRKSGPIENLELWQQAVAAVRGHAVEWRWVRGHNGHWGADEVGRVGGVGVWGVGVEGECGAEQDAVGGVSGWGGVSGVTSTPVLKGTGDGGRETGVRRPLGAAGGRGA